MDRNGFDVMGANEQGNQLFTPQRLADEDVAELKRIGVLRDKALALAPELRPAARSAPAAQGARS